MEKIGRIIKKYPEYELALLGKKLKYPVIKISKKDIKKFDLVLVAGIHGEEIAGPLMIYKYLDRILRGALKNNISMLIYPAVNFYGFERKERFNIERMSCNYSWIHYKHKMARESLLVKKDIKRYKLKYFLTLHEEGEQEENAFYLYCFGDKKIGEELVKTAKKKMPILRKGFHGNYGEDRINNGIIYDWHDGSFEDFAYHQGAKSSICTETPLWLPLETRIDANYSLVIKLISIIAKNG